MGSFVGHVVPGSFFIIFAIWWLIDTLHCYFRCDGRFQSRVVPYMTLCQGRRQMSLMACCTVGVTTVGMIVELVVAPLFLHGSFAAGTGVQHATMYFVFGLVGLQSIVLDYCAPNLLRRQIDFATTSLAFIVETVLFYFHLDGRLQIDITIHTFLIYVLYATVIVVLLEFWTENSLALPLARSYFTMLQGTWFIQLASMLYTPGRDPWGAHIVDIDDANDEMNMKAASIFAWHMIVIFIVYALVVLCWYRRCGSGKAVEMVGMMTKNDTQEEREELLAQENV